MPTPINNEHPSLALRRRRRRCAHPAASARDLLVGVVDLRHARSVRPGGSVSRPQHFVRFLEPRRVPRRHVPAVMHAVGESQEPGAEATEEGGEESHHAPPVMNQMMTNPTRYSSFNIAYFPSLRCECGRRKSSQPSLARTSTQRADRGRPCRASRQCHPSRPSRHPASCPRRATSARCA